MGLDGLSTIRLPRGGEGEVTATVIAVSATASRCVERQTLHWRRSAGDGRSRRSVTGQLRLRPPGRPRSLSDSVPAMDFSITSPARR